MTFRTLRARRAIGVALAAVVGVACGTLAPAARADTPPSRWDRARDPAAGRSWRLHLEVQRRLALERELPVGAGFSAPVESLRESARILLERADAERSDDVRLRFDLGAVYLQLGSTRGGDYYARAVSVLTAALAKAPDHPAAEGAWLRLAFACGHLGDHPCERRAYLKVLSYATEEVARATPNLNLSETEMHLGNLREAIDGYRETLRIASRIGLRDTTSLALWGLAVALDRAGDRAAAEREARLAVELERNSTGVSLLRSDGVFFVPAHEIHWYEGLGAIARARVATDPEAIVQLWRAAEKSFDAYVRAANRGGDRWLALARVRLAAVKAERERAERAERRSPSREPSGAPFEISL